MVIEDKAIEEAEDELLGKPLSEVEYAPKGMFPEDDDDDMDDDSFEIDIDEDLDVWNRGGGYTWGGGTSWWQRSYGGSSMTGMWSTNVYTEDNHAGRMLKNKGHIDSLCKVVDPTVAHTLEFATRHGSGHTDMRRGHIVVDGSLIRYNDNKLDTLAGLAIHEKLHVIHSMPLMTWQREVRPTLCKTDGEIELFQSVSNIVEDEYIERQLHKTCAGYVHYIEACKDHYFAKSEIGVSEGTSEFGDLINTFLMLVRYPSKIDLDRRKRHAPHIRILMSAIKSGIDSRDNTKTCIKLVYKYLIAQAERMAKESGEDTEKVMADLKKEAGDYAIDRIEESFGKDGDPDSDIDSRMRKEMIDSITSDKFKALKRRYERDMVDRHGVDKVWDEAHRRMIEKLGSYDADYDTISKEMDKKIKDMADSDYYETDIGKLAINKGQKDITWQKHLPSEHSVQRYRDAKIHMRSQISKLKKKVQLYGNLQKHNIYNQKRGMLNKRQLHKIPMGMTDLFKSTVINEDKPLDVCLLVDESGSMGSYTMANARNGAIAIKEALSGNDKINLWVYGHSADESKRGVTEMIEYFSPTMQDRPMAMGGMKARYENRDGNAIIASAQRIKGESDNQSHKLMIVLSDGSPSADGYRGGQAINHTKRAVKYAETQGWSIIQVGFSGARDWNMKEMFDNWVFVEDDNMLGDTVSKIIRKVIKI